MGGGLNTQNPPPGYATELQSQIIQIITKSIIIIYEIHYVYFAMYDGSFMQHKPHMQYGYQATYRYEATYIGLFVFESGAKYSQTIQQV